MVSEGFESRRTDLGYRTSCPGRARGAMNRAPTRNRHRAGEQTQAAVSHANRGQIMVYAPPDSECPPDQGHARGWTTLPTR
jgi:hypothetical protein